MWNWEREGTEEWHIFFVGAGIDDLILVIVRNFLEEWYFWVVPLLSYVSLTSGTFEDKEITHVEGEVDPVRDLDIINEELRLKDEEAFNKVYDELAKKYERGEKKLKAEYVSSQLAYLWLHCRGMEVVFKVRAKLFKHWNDVMSSDNAALRAWNSPNEMRFSHLIT